jgi:hypothetical protein
MGNWFDVNHLDAERLLKEWRWLLPETVTLVAKSAYGDLFLRNANGEILKLDVAIARIQKVAESEIEFRELANTQENQEQWFAKSDELAAAERGLVPNSIQCIGFSIPLVLRSPETNVPNKPYVADLYEYVSFLGDLNHQISDMPDGASVQLKIERKL